jgi:hypothetical protein
MHLTYGGTLQHSTLLVLNVMQLTQVTETPVMEVGPTLVSIALHVTT